MCQVLQVFELVVSEFSCLAMLLFSWVIWCTIQIRLHGAKQNQTSGFTAHFIEIKMEPKCPHLQELQELQKCSKSKCLDLLVATYDHIRVRQRCQLCMICMPPEPHAVCGIVVCKAETFLEQAQAMSIDRQHKAI